MEPATGVAANVTRVPRWETRSAGTSAIDATQGARYRARPRSTSLHGQTRHGDGANRGKEASPASRVTLEVASKSSLAQLPRIINVLQNNHLSHFEQTTD